MTAIGPCANIDVSNLNSYTRQVQDERDIFEKISYGLGICAALCVLLLMITCFLEYRESIRVLGVISGYLIILAGVLMGVCYVLLLEKTTNLQDVVSNAVGTCDPRGIYSKVIFDLRNSVGVETTQLKFLLSIILWAAVTFFLSGIFLVFCLYTLKQAWKDQDIYNRAYRGRGSPIPQVPMVAVESSPFHQYYPQRDLGYAG